MLTREQITYRALYFLNAYPSLYMPIASIRYLRSTDLLVTRDTQLVIEGFGRSGSTFANFAFLSAQTRPVKTVHHTHAAAQVITAVCMGIPTLVIVRKPLDAVLSHMARFLIQPRAALVAWIRFHERILPYCERLVITSFDTMTKDFGAVIRRINEKFFTQFGIWQHTKENEAQVFEQIRRRNRTRFGDVPSPARSRALAIPTLAREIVKEKLQAQLQAERLAPIRHRAEQLYTRIIMFERD